MRNIFGRWRGVRNILVGEGVRNILVGGGGEEHSS